MAKCIKRPFSTFILKVPSELPQFDITDEDFKIYAEEMNQAPCNKIKAFIDDQIENQKELLKPKFPGVTIKPEIQERHFDIAYLETMYQRYFRCGFKATFSGALKRVFTGMNAVKKYEVTMIRKYNSAHHELQLCHTGDGACYVAEFSLQSKFQLYKNSSGYIYN